MVFVGLRFGVNCALADLTGKHFEYGSHLTESGTCLLREGRARELVPIMHHFEIQYQEPILERLQAKSGGMFHKVNQYPIVPLQGLMNRIELLVIPQRFPHIHHLKTALRHTSCSAKLVRIVAQQQHATISEPIDQQSSGHPNNQYAGEHLTP